MTIALLNPAFDTIARYETTDDVDRGFARGEVDVETAAHALRLLERGYGPGTIGLMNVRDVHILAERMRAEVEEDDGLDGWPREALVEEVRRLREVGRG